MENPSPPEAGDSPLEKQPKRIQRQRTKGWRMPDGAVYVGRPTKWGNEWDLGDAKSRGIDEPRDQRAWAVRAYREEVDHWRTLPWSDYHPDNIRRLLRGKDLACWCPLDQPCHADVLLEIANEN